MKYSHPSCICNLPTCMKCKRRNGAIAKWNKIKDEKEHGIDKRSNEYWEKIYKEKFEDPHYYDKDRDNKELKSDIPSTLGGREFVVSGVGRRIGKSNKGGADDFFDGYVTRFRRGI